MSSRLQAGLSYVRFVIRSPNRRMYLSRAGVVCQMRVEGEGT